MNKFIKSLGIVPSPLVFLTDVLCICCAALLAMFVRVEFDLQNSSVFEPKHYLIIPAIILAVRIFYFLVFRTPKIIVR
ncbi:MAG: hypothetical protein II894_02670, partial [Bacteroidales bacterium]|nr:hypothetical protein [Bacteroidales bacterium]